MLRIAIGLLLVVSSSTGHIAFIGYAGGKTLLLLGMLLLTSEYVLQAAKRRRPLPAVIRNRRSFHWLDAK